MVDYVESLQTRILPTLKINILQGAFMRWYTWSFATLVFVVSLFALPYGGRDWAADIAPAARQWWDAPWLEGLPLPPYAALVLHPVAILPMSMGTALVNSFSVILLARLARRWGGAEWIAVLVLSTPAGYWLFRNGQLDVLILSGILLPDWAGILVYTLKPQVGLWIVVARLRRLFSTALIPAGVVGASSLLLWGWWPGQLLHYAGVLIPSDWNSSLCPYSIPAGLICVWFAWRRQDERYGAAASPLLFPYVNLPSYIGLLTILACCWPKWAVIVWCSLWIVGTAWMFLV